MKISSELLTDESLENLKKLRPRLTAKNLKVEEKPTSEANEDENQKSGPGTPAFR